MRRGWPVPRAATQPCECSAGERFGGFVRVRVCAQVCVQEGTGVEREEIERKAQRAAGTRVSRRERQVRLGLEEG